MQEYDNERRYSDMQRPNDLLVWSILSTVLCCIATGIVAIVYSSRVNPLWEGGRHEEARESARKAKIWLLVGVGLGILVGVLYTVYVSLIASAVAASGGLDNLADFLNRLD